jgi:hypothetical protein
MKWEDMGFDGRHALEMVGGRLYKLPPHITLIHEIIGNANDEFAKGLTNNPTITIDFEKHENGEFFGLIIFKNNAPPIPADFFKKDYHMMFKSNKSSESGGIGFVGIGAKQFLQSKPYRELITITGNDSKSLLSSIWQWPNSGNPQVAKTPTTSHSEIIGSRKISHMEGTTFAANLTKEEFLDLKDNLVYYLHKYWNHALLNDTFKILISGNNVDPWIPSIKKYTRHFTLHSKKIKCIFWISDVELTENHDEFPHILYVVGDKRITDKTIRDTHRIIKNYSKRIFCYADVSPLLKKYVLMSKEDFEDGQSYVSKVKQRVTDEFWAFIREQNLYKEEKIDKTNDIESQMILQKFNEILQSKEFKKWNPFLLKTRREVPVRSSSGDEALSESDGFQKSGEGSVHSSSEGVLGSDDGTGNVYDKKGDQKGNKKIRNALGIDMGEIDAPEEEKEAWIDDGSRSLLINIGHPFYQKIQNDSQKSGLLNLREFNKKRIMVDALVRFRIDMNDGTPAEIIEESHKLLHQVH